MNNYITCGNSSACLAAKQLFVPPPPLLHHSWTSWEACSTLNTFSLLAYDERTHLISR